MRRLSMRAVLIGGLLLATWGLIRTVPTLLDAEAGYVARALYIVLLWMFLWVGSAFALVRSLWSDAHESDS